MAKKKETRGGARPGSGKKKMADSEKKQQITLYLTGQQIEENGGKEAIREKCYKLLKLLKKQ